METAGPLFVGIIFGFGCGVLLAAIYEANKS